MKRSYAGQSIDLGTVVWIFDVWLGWPVFHRGRHDLTACGLALHDRGSLAGATALPPRHAARIGRPCRRCWPTLAGQRSLADAIEANRGV